MALRLFSRTKAATGTLKPQKESEGGNGQVPVPSSPSAYQPAPREALPSDPARRLLQQGRYNLILREADKWRDQPGGSTVVEEAKQQLDRRMALVPAGSVLFATTLSDISSATMLVSSALFFGSTSSRFVIAVTARAGPRKCCSM